MAKRCTPNKPCGGGMQKGLFNPFFIGSGGGTADTTADGRQAILVLGDSIPAGLTSHTASTLPAAGTAYEYDRNTNTIINFGAGAGITGFSFNSKSPWAKFCIDYNANSGYKPVIINRAAASSTVSPAISGLVGNDWQTSGTNYNAAITAADDCLAQLGLTKLKAIHIIALINDVQGQSGTGPLTVAQISAYYDTFIGNLIAHFGSDVPIIVSAIGLTDTIRVNTKLTGCRNISIQKSVSTANHYIGASLTSFFVNGLFESDNIHPNVTGNDYLGAMFARWHKNSTITNKWARAIISSHFDELSDTYKGTIQSVISANETAYLNSDMLYNFWTTLKLNANFDWTFRCGPEADGGYSFVANSHISSDGSTPTLFNLGYSQSISPLMATQNDCLLEVSLKQVDTPSGTTAAPIGSLSSGANSLLRQLNTLGINWTMRTNTSFTYAGESSFGAGSYMLLRSASNASALYKNGVSVATTATASTAGATGNMVLGAFLNTGVVTSPIAAQYKRCMAAKQSTISDKVAFLAALDTLHP